MMSKKITAWLVFFFRFLFASNNQSAFQTLRLRNAAEDRLAHTAIERYLRNEQVLIWRNHFLPRKILNRFLFLYGGHATWRDWSGSEKWPAVSSDRRLTSQTCLLDLNILFIQKNFLSKFHRSKEFSQSAATRREVNLSSMPHCSFWCSMGYLLS